MLLRRWHRWIAVPAALFMLFIAATGIALHADMMLHGQTPPPAGPPGPAEVQPVPSDAELAAMMATLAKAARDNPDLGITSLQVQLAGKSVRLSAGTAVFGQGITIDAVTGNVIETPKPAEDYHYVLQDLHAGYFAGWTGRVVSILAGLSLLVLSVTGLQMWWTMKTRGKRGLFWK